MARKKKATGVPYKDFHYWEKSLNTLGEIPYLRALNLFSICFSLLSNQYFLPMQQQLYETSRPNFLDQAVLYYVKHCRRKQHVEYRSTFLSRMRSTKIQGDNKKAQK